jgi:hypothetical protein
MNITWNDDVNRIEGHLDENAKWWRKDLPPGSACWVRGYKTEKIVYIRFVCPCGCGAVHGVPVDKSFGSAWDFNGDYQKPTLTPSIQILSGCRWHGYITDGTFKTC